jgi:hypothetical protein
LIMAMMSFIRPPAVFHQEAEQGTCQFDATQHFGEYWRFGCDEPSQESPKSAAVAKNCLNFRHS